MLVENVLSKELTTIPTWIKSILGEYYNNTLCNGVTWMLVIWKIIRIFYDELLHRYLKQLGTKQYIRTRVTNSLWYCGFFTSVLAYYIVTLDRNKLNILKGSHVVLYEDLPFQVILVYTVQCTFYLHAALSEGIQGGSLHLFLQFSLMVIVFTSAYILRLLEIPFTLSALIAIPTVIGELLKLFLCLFGQVYQSKNIFLGALYVVSLVLFSLIHLAIIPLIFLVPLGKRLISDGGIIFIILFLSLFSWLGTTIYNSILHKSINHWLIHDFKQISNQEQGEVDEKNEEKIDCPGNLIECSLFPSRTDDAYILNVYRSDIKKRKIEMEARKKPKARNMIIQTLKCMMAIKKKFKEKRLSESSDSDESDGPDEDSAENSTADSKIVQESENCKENSRPGVEIEEIEEETVDENEDCPKNCKSKVKIVEVDDDVVKESRSCQENSKCEVKIVEINDEDTEERDSRSKYVVNTEEINDESISQSVTPDLEISRSSEACKSTCTMEKEELEGSLKTEDRTDNECDDKSSH